MQREVLYFRAKNGSEPFSEWLEGLPDAVARIRIIDRLARVRSGNLGDHKSVGGGVWELRFTFGPGYRLYFGKDGDRLIVLLIGGDKSSQKKDIRLAQAYWKEYVDEN